MFYRRNYLIAQTARIDSNANVHYSFPFLDFAFLTLSTKKKFLMFVHISCGKNDLACGKMHKKH